MITEIVLIFDHARQTLRVCSNSKVSDNPEKDYKYAVKKIEETIDLLSKPLSLQPAPLGRIGLSSEKPPVGNFSQKEFETLVEKTKGYIKEGDIIQAVLSQRFSIPYNGTPINLYRAIRAINPSPYMFILETNDYSIVGASPEVHVRLNEDNVLIRPIAGTRPRGKTEKEDQKFELSLIHRGYSQGF